MSTDYLCYLHMTVMYKHAFDRNAVERNFTKIFEALNFFGSITNHTRYQIKGNVLVTTEHAIETTSSVKGSWFQDECDRFLEHAQILYD